MPQASEELRKYWNHDSAPEGADQRCMKVLDEAGIKYPLGVILLEQNKDYGEHVNKAIDYLCDEWDFATEYLPLESKTDAQD